MSSQVKSELYTETNFETEKSSNGRVLSKFIYSLPSSFVEVPEEDEDGDFILSRIAKGSILIEHLESTILSLVGLQVWRGALLLADFILFHGKTYFNDKDFLELGSGVGLTSVIAGIYARSVVCTDINIGGILSLIQDNFNLNKETIKCKNMKVMELDFKGIENWSKEIKTVIKNSNIILAADVIYDDDLTEAFVATVEEVLLLGSSTTIFVALEKRYVFTLADMDTCAPCYEHFLKFLDKMKNRHSGWKMESVPLDFPQYFHYERSNALVLWKISN